MHQIKKNVVESPYIQLGVTSVDVEIEMLFHFAAFLKVMNCQEHELAKIDLKQKRLFGKTIILQIQN